MAIFLLGGLLTVLHAVPALAGPEFAPSSIKKGVLLVASPSLEDPNFRQAVVLIVEHGPQGTFGLILNRSTRVLLSDALPEITVLKGTTYRLFSGGPVEQGRLLLLFRLKEPPGDARSVFDGIYVGGTARASWSASLHRPNRPKPSGPLPDLPHGLRRQLEAEMLVGAWGVLPPDPIGMFDRDPAVLWQDCISRLQAPRVISN